MVESVKSTLMRVARAFIGTKRDLYYRGLSKDKLQKLWLVGALDRLSSLGFISNCPYRLRDNFNDLFTSLDPDRLFQSDGEIVNTLSVILREETPGGDTIPCIEVAAMGDLVLSYKEDPETLVKIYLQRNEKNLL